MSEDRERQKAGMAEDRPRPSYIDTESHLIHRMAVFLKRNYQYKIKTFIIGSFSERND